MDDWSQLEQTLDTMTASGSVEVHEDGQWLAELSGLHCEIRREGKQPLVHLWSDDRNLVRRIRRITLSSKCGASAPTGLRALNSLQRKDRGERAV